MLGGTKQFFSTASKTKGSPESRVQYPCYNSQSTEDRSRTGCPGHGHHSKRPSPLVDLKKHGHRVMQIISAIIICANPHTQLCPDNTSRMEARQVVLHNGVCMPRLGLGTFKAKGEDVKQAVRWALGNGYSMIDTASIYKNEREIGDAIRESGAHRDQIFVTSKVSPFEHGFEKAKQAVNDILERLGCGYLDLCLIHWPGVAKQDLKSTKNSQLRRETWCALEQLYKEAKCRAIGVSNYNSRHLTEVLASCEIKPMVNQVEVHPQLQQLHLREFCAAHKICVQAYSPLGCGGLLQDPAVCNIARNLIRSPSQVLLRWGLQNDLVVLPKSVQERHIRENADIFSFVLSEIDMQMLGSLERGQHLCWSAEEVR